MPITNDTELRDVTEEVGVGLDEIQRYLGTRNHANGKVKFPRGYIRTASSVRTRLWYIRDETVKRNLAYAHMQADVHRWLLNRTDLAGTAKEMIIKELICLMATIAETLTMQVVTQEGICGKNKKFKKRCEALLRHDAISESILDELAWLWDMRQNEHIFLASDWEFGYYKMRDCNRSIKCLHSLKDELDEWFEKGLPF